MFQVVPSVYEKVMKTCFSEFCCLTRTKSQDFKIFINILREDVEKKF